MEKNFAVREPSPLTISQQKSTSEIVISLPENWERNSRTVIIWAAIEDIPVPITDIIIRVVRFIEITNTKIQISNYILPGVVLELDISYPLFLLFRVRIPQRFNRMNVNFELWHSNRYF
ncbi:MAG: hypothetical protein ACQEQO_12685 [Thermodesulfobacteriota bacterium]